jgi:hypothetical protein
MYFKEKNFVNGFTLYVLPISMIIIFSISGMAQRRNLIFECGFESDRCGANAEIEGGSLTIVNSPARVGNGSLKVVNSGVRAELKGNGAGGPNIEGGKERWFAVSVFIPNDYKGSTSGTDMFLQIHERPDDCEGWRSPPLNFGARGEEMWITVKWDANACSTGGGVPAGGGEKQIWKDSLSKYKGRWSDWVIHTIWSYKSDGLTEAWVDGRKVVEYHGMNAYNDSKEYYWKSGSYKRFDGTTMHYMDELRIGNGNATYADVAPGNGSIVPSGCKVASSGGPWINNNFTGQTGAFTAEFDVTPSAASMDALVGLSNGSQSSYPGFATIIRFNTSGNIDARNGGAYAAASAIPYSANTSYHFRLVINISSHTYSIYVTPAGGTEKTVGTNYAFRTEQASVSQLNNWGAFVSSATGSLQVCNFQIGGASTPTPTPTPSTLIDDNCSSLTNFTKVSGGTWSVNSNGQCALTAAATSCTGPLCNLLTHNTSITGDFTLTADAGAAATSGSWDEFAIVFNYKDASNYYYVVFNESDSPTTNGIFKVQAGTNTEILDFGTNVTVPGTTLTQVKIERVGSTIKVHRGGLMWNVTDSTFTGGKVGFATFNNNASFDNLKVIP